MGRKRKNIRARQRDLSQDEREREQRDSIHGNIYQLKLLMLFLCGGIENEYSFRLGSEIKECRKFDDLMFEYTEGDGKIFRLLQAKHRKDQTKKITASELLTESDSDFSLIKYFFSYQDLKEEKLFQEGTIKDVIICTNINVDIADLERAGVSIEEIKEEDKILDINCRSSNKKSVRYKFCKNVISLLKPKLENYYLSKLATRLADCILNNKPMQHHLKDDVFSKYHQALAEDVINVKSKNFQEKFITNTNIASTAKRLRDIFENELKKKTENKLTLETLNEEIANKSILNEQISLQLSKKFGQGGNLIEVWPQNLICDDDINDFLNHLVFAINQPNEEELGNVLKDKIGSGYNYIKTKNLYDKVFQGMLQLLQGKKGIRFLTDVEGKELFEVGKKEIFSNPSFQYDDELYYVTFQRNIKFKNIDYFQNFISSGHSLWIMHSETPWLFSLVVYQELIRSNQNLKYLFVPSSYLQSNPDVISDFKDIELWIVICSLNEDTDSVKIENIVDSFQKSNTNNKTAQAVKSAETDKTTKRLIYITPYHDDLRKTCTRNNFYYDEVLRINFSDLTGESQLLITQEEVIRFQGNVKKQNIKELLELNEQEGAFQREIENLNLNPCDLELLLRNQQVDIWKGRPRFSDLEPVHYKPHTQLKLHQVKESVETNRNDIFSFEGDEDQIKMLLPSEQSELNKFKEMGSTSSTKIPHFILLDEGQSAEQFRELCAIIDESNAEVKCTIDLPLLHLLKGTENGWVWAQSYNRNIYVQRYFIPPNFVVKNIKNLLIQNKSHVFIIISGISKETLSNILDISKQRLTKKNTFISLSHKGAEFHFYKKIKCQRYKSILWLKEKRGNFYKEKIYWHPSKGDSNEIRKLIDIDENHVLPEQDLMNSKERVILLAGESGVGKSFTLAHIAEELKNINPSFLVIKVELKKLQKMLTSKSYCTLSNVVDLLQLLDSNAEKNSLTKKIFTHMLLYTDKVKIFWDGFDELSSQRQGDVLKLFKTIQKETLASMWITTRRHDQEKLEKELAVSAYTFSPGNDKFQASILTQFWNTALKFSCKSTEQFRTILEKHAKEIMHSFDSKFDNVENFMSIPLIMSMMAEIHLAKIGSTIIGDSSENSSEAKNYLLIEDIYGAFVDMKYDIYLYEKLNVGSRLDRESLSALKKQYTKAYGRLALKIMQNEFHFSRDCIHDKKEIFSLNTLSKIGLAEGYEYSANFIHRTFVEYFAAERITSKLACNPVSSSVGIKLWDVFLNKIMMCSNGRKFFEDKLTRGDEIENLLNHTEQKDIVYSLILKQSLSGHSVLWYAAMDGLERTLKFLLKSARNFNFLKEISLKLFEDEIFNVHVNYVLLIKTILSYGNDLDATRVDELIATNKTNLLHRAVVKGDLILVDILISYLQDSDKIVEFITSGPFYHSYGETALHIAFENSSIDIVQKCIEKLNDTQRSKVLNIRDFLNNLPSDNATSEIKEIFNCFFQKYIEIPELNIRIIEEIQESTYSHLKNYIRVKFPSTVFNPLHFEPYLPAIEKSKTPFRGAVISRFFSQFLFLIKFDILVDILKYVKNFYAESWELKLPNLRWKRDNSLVSLFAKFLSELDFSDQILPSRFVIHSEYKTTETLRHYILEEIGNRADFAMLLGFANHVLAICRKDMKYVYFDFRMGIIFNLTQISDILDVLETAAGVFGYNQSQKGFLVQHFNTLAANLELLRMNYMRSYIPQHPFSLQYEAQTESYYNFHLQEIYEIGHFLYKLSDFKF